MKKLYILTIISVFFAMSVNAVCYLKPGKVTGAACVLDQLNENSSNKSGNYYIPNQIKLRKNINNNSTQFDSNKNEEYDNSMGLFLLKKIYKFK